MAALAVVSLVVGLLPNAAAATPAPAAEDAAGSFAPTTVRTGSVVPATPVSAARQAATQARSAAMARVQEVVQLRAAGARTYRLGDGRYETELRPGADDSGGPVGEIVDHQVTDGGGEVGVASAWYVDVLDGDCTLLESGGDGCGSATLAVGMHQGQDGPVRERSVLRFDVASVLPSPAHVLHATVELTAATGSDIGAVDVHPLTRVWADPGTTWTDATGSEPWASAGGDFDTEALNRNPVAGDAGLQGSVWHVTAAAQAWVDEPAGNHGVLLKAADETVVQRMLFHGSASSQTEARPTLRIVWEARMGLGEPVRTHRLDLGGQRAVHTNVVNGNLVIDETDFSVAGTAGHDFAYRRVFNMNSFVEWDSSLPTGWSHPAGTLATLLDIPDPDHAVVWRDPETGDSVGFTRDTHGDWIPAHRLTAELTRDGDGRWHLRRHRSGETLVYDASGWLQQRRDRNGNAITWGYDGHSRVASITDTQARVTTFDYDGDGRLETITDPAGRTHTYTQQSSGCWVCLGSHSDPDGNTTTYQRSQAGDGTEVRDIIDAEGNLTRVRFHPWSPELVTQPVRSVTRVTNPATGEGPTWEFTYDQANRTTTMTDPRGNPTTWHYDTKGQVTKVVDALGRERSTSWSPTGSVAGVTNNHGLGLTTYTYSTDGRDNLTGVSQDTGSGSTLTSTLAYENVDHPFSPSRYTAPQGTVVNYGYDAAGNLNCLNQLAGPTDVCDYTGTPQAGQWQTDHNPDGTIARTIDPNGNATDYTWTYNAGGQLVTLDITHPAPRGAEQLTFDLLGRMTSRTDGNNQLTSYGYDVLDRVISTTYPDNMQVTYSYDQVGNRTLMTDPTGTSSWTFDELHRLVSEALPGNVSLSYGYDAVGNLTSFNDGAGAITYTHDQVNRVATVTDPGAGAQTTTFAYDDDIDGVHDRKTTTYPNGVTQVELVDQAGRLVDITATLGPSALTSFAYTYEAQGADGTPLRSSVTDHTGATTSYDYDDHDRLEHAVKTAAGGGVVQSHAYTYDPAGNRLSQTRNSTVTTYDHNAANQMTRAGATTFTYDGAGNQTGSSAGQDLVYNAAGQMLSAQRTANSSTQSYSYADDTQVHMVQLNTSRVVNAAHGTVRIGNNRYTRTPHGTLTTRWRTDGSRAYYLHDGLGSTAALVDATGTVVNRYTYEPSAKAPAPAPPAPASATTSATPAATTTAPPE